MILLKSSKEIDKIRASCRIVRETLDLLKTKIRTGISTKELNTIGEEFIYSKMDEAKMFGGVRDQEGL